MSSPNIWVHTHTNIVHTLATRVCGSILESIQSAADCPGCAQVRVFVEMATLTTIHGAVRSVVREIILERLEGITV